MTEYAYSRNDPCISLDTSMSSMFSTTSGSGSGVFGVIPAVSSGRRIGWVCRVEGAGRGVRRARRGTMPPMLPALDSAAAHLTDVLPSCIAALDGAPNVLELPAV